MCSAGHARGCRSNAGRAGSPRIPIFADQADPLLELFEIDGLDDVRAAAMPVHGEYLPLLGGGGQDHHRLLCFRWVCLVFNEHFVAIHARHVQIEVCCCTRCSSNSLVCRKAFSRRLRSVMSAIALNTYRPSSISMG